MIRNLVFLLSMLLILNSCYNSTKYELTIDKEAYYGNEFKLDGYYYHQYETSNNTIQTKVLFFYRNGVVFDGAIFPTKSLDTIDNYFINNQHMPFIEDSWVWSTFRVTNDSLIYETWNPPTISEGPEPRKHYCKLLNDTTFRVFKFKLFTKKVYNEVNDIYHFRKFDNKPDSTNSFIR